MKNFFLLAMPILLTTAAGADEIPAEQAQREAEFAERYSSCDLVGSFTVDGRTDQPPKAERYEIESVKKFSGNLWTFLVHIKYGKVDTRLPITVPVVWADDTPMIALTDATLPGLGSAFSCRVIFHGDRYAGTWQHGKAGGHMFGRIEKKAQADAATDGSSTPE